jgi:hypothetical protein
VVVVLLWAHFFTFSEAENGRMIMARPSDWSHNRTQPCAASGQQLQWTIQTRIKILSQIIDDAKTARTERWNQSRIDRYAALLVRLLVSCCK